MGKKKKFIDKKNAVTFHLVHRSQQDPLVVDENAPARVLAEVGKKPSKSTPDELKTKKEEERKYGVYYDDDYDYLQHLRSRDEFQADLEPVERFRVEAPAATKKPGKGLSLPSSVFESSVKEKVGVLNKAAPIYGPRLDVDPDVAAALDDDFDFENPDNELEDDFIAKAMDESPAEEGGSEESESEEGSDEDEEWSDMEQDNDDGRSHAFTNYSMTSSVIRRNAGLKLIDAHFERIVETEYDDTEIGALDEDEIGGRLDPNSELLLKLADEFKAATAFQKLPEKEVAGNVGESDDEVEEMVEVVEELTDNFDCQSILSTRTNQSRFTPRLIREKQPIKINRKTGLPEGVFGSSLTADNLQRLTGLDSTDKTEKRMDDNMSLVSRISALSMRSKNETPEERRVRKGTVKQLRRERRVEKKANTEAFKKEKQMQIQTSMNVQMNCLGRKLV